MPRLSLLDDPDLPVRIRARDGEALTAVVDGEVSIEILLEAHNR